MLLQDMEAIRPPSGRFVGRADWFDETGASGDYDATLIIEIGDDSFILQARHVFDNGDPDTNSRFELSPVTSKLFTVTAEGHRVGKGYIVNGFCHYTLVFGENIVENNITWSDGLMFVYGSATRNAAGRHIAWKEQLTKEDFNGSS